MVLSTEAGRYTNIPVELRDRFPREEQDDDRDVCYVIIHLFRDVVAFDQLDSYRDERHISLSEGTQVGLSQIAANIRVAMPPYGVPPRDLLCAVHRSGLRPRHILIRQGFEFTVGGHLTLTQPWVLVHLCKHDTMRGHYFHLFLPCGNLDNTESLDNKLDAEPFVRVTRRAGFFPHIFEEWRAGHACELIPRDCICQEGHEYEKLYRRNVPRIVRLLYELQTAHVI